MKKKEEISLFCGRKLKRRNIETRVGISVKWMALSIYFNIEKSKYIQ